MAKEVKSLLEFDDGNIQSQVNNELKKVLENIADINTSTKAREISIKLTLTPDEKRRHIAITAEVKSKMQPAHAIKTAMQINKQGDEIVAMELTAHADGQKDLFGTVHETKIVKIS